jgi:hypothetical protein
MAMVKCYFLIGVWREPILGRRIVFLKIRDSLSWLGLRFCEIYTKSKSNLSFHTPSIFFWKNEYPIA